jgi:hypothetical protein
MRQLDGLLMEHGGAPAGEAQDRLEPVVACRLRGIGVAMRHSVLLAERHHRTRPGQAQRLGQQATRDPLEQRSRHGGVERGIIRERVGEKAERLQ